MGVSGVVLRGGVRVLRGGERKVQNGRPEWIRTIDLFRVKEAL